MFIDNLFRKGIKGKVRWCLPFYLFTFLPLSAQQADPVVMTINGVPVPRSEFEYSFNKNNSDGVIDKKSVDEYVDLFVNYKLKVAAALDEKLDTLTSFKQEFAMYRDQQVRPTLVTDADVLAEARRAYDRTKEAIGSRGLIMPAHIFLRLSTKASPEEQEKVRLRADSVWRALKAGADFAELAGKVSQMQRTASRGGVIGWMQPNQTYPEFEEAAYALQPGEISQPVLTPDGYHIILMKERKQLEPFDELKDMIVRSFEQQGIRNAIADQKVSQLVDDSKGQLTKEELMSRRADSLAAVDPEAKYLIQEYHDGLLLYEISNRTIWDKAAQDEQALESFFKKHKKQYKWDEPRFKGMVYHVKDQADVKAVAKCVKKLKFDEWNEALRTTFNKDSVIRIRAEKGIFKKGDNKFVDREVFKVADVQVDSVKGYPIDAVYGKLLKKPQDYTDVRALVLTDLQDEMERQWVADLRRKYAVTVNEEVLKTINKHE